MRTLSCVLSLLLVLGCLPPALAAEIPLGRNAPITMHLKSPTGVAVDGDGNIYVTESATGGLYVYAPDGSYLKFRKNLDKPLGVAVDGSGRVYVCNAGKGNVTVYDRRLNPLHKLGAGDGEFRLPASVAVRGDGTAYVADARGDQVRIYRPDGAFAGAFGGSGSGDGRFDFPTSVAIDAAAGDVIVADLQTTSTGIQGARIQVFDRAGVFKRSFGSFGRGEGLLTKPLGVAAAAGGPIYVSDSYQNIVHVYDGRGNYLKTLYDSKHPLRTPLGLAVSGDGGRIYIASLGTGTVEVYAAESGGSGVLSFATSGGGGCTAASGRTASPLESIFPLLVLMILLIVRKGFAGRRRPGKGVRHP